MKSVRYFTLNFSGFTTAACEKQGYLRLIAGDHVFYTDKRYFNDPSLFDRLTINQPLHLGVRRLDNGSYWIYWLSDGETLLEPSQRVKRWARPLLSISLLTLIVALIPLVMSTSEWGRFGFGIIAILAFIALLTGLCELLFHRALKMHPAMRDLLAKMAQARRRDFSFCQPLPTTAQTLRQSAKPFTQALPERYAVRTGKISNIIFKKWFAGNPTREYHGVGIQCDTAPLAFFWQNGFANFGLHPFFYRRQPPFLAIGDRIVAVYQRKDNDVQALYNVSDGGAFLKNHPCYPGDRQMSLVYNLFYGMVLVMYLLILGMSLNNPYKPARGFGWLIQDSLDMLSLLLLSFGGILAVLELIGPTAWLLSHRVADWMKMRSAMRHYLQGAARHTALEEIM
ncbi:lipoprotein [Klebsiella pneumoniae]|nr:lipoprotein [Klebsiella pneumoniae]